MSVNVGEEEKKEYPLGFKASKKQRDELQKWADFFAGQKSVDPETGKSVPIIEKNEIGLLIKEATYAFIYQYKFFLQMRNNPQLMQFVEQFQQQLSAGGQSQNG